MKTNKVFKWLYGVFVFLPMLAIGVTCAYVTFNKNAKDSYYGDTINQQEYVDTTTLEQNKEYSFTIGNNLLQTQSNYISVNNVDLSNSPTAYSQSVLDNKDYINQFRVLYNTSSQATYLVFTFSNGTSASYVAFGSGTTLSGNYSFTFYVTNNNENILPNNIKVIEYNKNSYLDNAFYYAVDQFNESGFNKIDFVSFFDMFYENTNIWTTFANTYLNYVLFVSLAFFIPRVLYWFINLAFSLTDSFERKSQRW